MLDLFGPFRKLLFLESHNSFLSIYAHRVLTYTKNVMVQWPITMYTYKLLSKLCLKPLSAHLWSVC